MRLELPWPPKELSPNARVHWTTKADASKRCRHFAGMAALQHKTKFRPSATIQVALTFHAPDKRRRDLDNLLASCKAYLDGVADALKVDDQHFVLQIQRGEIVDGGKVVIEIR